MTYRTPALTESTPPFLPNASTLLKRREEALDAAYADGIRMAKEFKKIGPPHGRHQNWQHLEAALIQDSRGYIDADTWIGRNNYRGTALVRYYAGFAHEMSKTLENLGYHVELNDRVFIVYLTDPKKKSEETQ